MLLADVEALPERRQLLFPIKEGALPRLSWGGRPGLTHVQKFQSVFSEDSLGVSDESQFSLFSFWKSSYSISNQEVTQRIT